MYEYTQRSTLSYGTTSNRFSPSALYIDCSGCSVIVSSRMVPNGYSSTSSPCETFHSSPSPVRKGKCIPSSCVSLIEKWMALQTTMFKKEQEVVLNGWHEFT